MLCTTDKGSIVVCVRVKLALNQLSVLNNSE